MNNLKYHTVHVVIKNLSRFPIEAVWENAKDLEHVTRLHSNTNHKFQLLFYNSFPDSHHEYDTLFYRAVRKLFFLKFKAFGIRRIVKEFNIHQLEYIPWMNTTSALNSMLFRNKDPHYPTLMVDEVVMDIPWILKPSENYIKKLLKRHAAIQCSEDEPFRARRSLLREKKISLPFRFFSESDWKKLTGKFNLDVSQDPMSIEPASI